MKFKQNPKKSIWTHAILFTKTYTSDIRKINYGKVTYIRESVMPKSQQVPRTTGELR